MSPTQVSPVPTHDSEEHSHTASEASCRWPIEISGGSCARCGWANSLVPK